MSGNRFIRDVVSSDCRVDILRILRGGARTTDEVLADCGCGGSTVRRNLKILREEGLVERRDGAYGLARDKRFLLEELLETADLFDAYGEHRDFWDRHDLSAVPEGLRKGLGGLRGGEVVRGTTARPREGMDRYCDLVRRSGWAKVISPTVVPKFIGAFGEAMRNGAQVSAVLTPELRSILREEYGEWLSSPEIADRLEIRVADDVRLGLTVTDLFMRLVLHRNDGTYDLDTFYLSEEPEAREWAERLFDHFRSRADRAVTK